MGAVPKRKLTATEYLALERAAPFKSEFYDGEMFAMAGASHQHNAIKENLIGELFNQLKKGPCRSYSSDQRVLVRSTGLYTYPDIVIVCGEPQFTDGENDTLVNPRVVIEVLSDSTRTYDRTIKFKQYAELSSMLEYVLVWQDQPLIERFVRQDGEDWKYRQFGTLEETFALATVAAAVPMADVYRDVTFPEPPDRRDSEVREDGSAR